MCDICVAYDSASANARKTGYAVKAVDKGLRWLNSVDPEWFKKVDLSNLAMTAANGCILGQVFRDAPERYAGQSGYDKGEDLILNQFPEDRDYNREEDPYTLGFNTHDSNWTQLQDEWTKVVRELQEAAESNV